MKIQLQVKLLQIHLEIRVRSYNTNTFGNSFQNTNTKMYTNTFANAAVWSNPIMLSPKIQKNKNTNKFKIQ